MTNQVAAVDSEQRKRRHDESSPYKVVDVVCSAVGKRKELKRALKTEGWGAAPEFLPHGPTSPRIP